MTPLQIIKPLIAENCLDEAMTVLDGAIAAAPADDALHFERGKLLWRLGRRREAYAAYAEAVRINPSSPAAHALEMARDIDAFFNPDLYNP